MKAKNLLVILTVFAVSGVAVSACKKEEQGRPLSFTKGTYGGAPDSALSEETRRALRARADRMR